MAKNDGKPATEAEADQERRFGITLNATAEISDLSHVVRGLIDHGPHDHAGVAIKALMARIAELSNALLFTVDPGDGKGLDDAVAILRATA